MADSTTELATELRRVAEPYKLLSDERGYMSGQMLEAASALETLSERVRELEGLTGYNADVADFHDANSLRWFNKAKELERDLSAARERVVKLSGLLDRMTSQAEVAKKYADTEPEARRSAVPTVFQIQVDHFLDFAREYKAIRARALSNQDGAV